MSILAQTDNLFTNLYKITFSHHVPSSSSFGSSFCVSGNKNDKKPATNAIEEKTINGRGL